MAIVGMGGAVGGLEVGSALVLILCFSHPLTTNTATQTPTFLTNLPTSLPDLIHQLGGQAWAPHHQDLNPQNLRRAHQLGLITNTWTVNNPQNINHLTQIDGILTDYLMNSG